MSEPGPAAHRLELVLLFGVPGSGKSSFYRAHFAQSHVHLSKDNWPNARHRQQRLERLLHEALARGEAVVVDNTQPSPRDREPLIAIARSYRAPVIGYFFDEAIDDCIARNAKRVGRARVDEIAIFIAAKNLQVPTYEEGFDQLFRVRLEGGTQSVSAMPRP